MFDATRFPMLLVAGCLLATISVVSARDLPKRDSPAPMGRNFDISSLDISNADDDSNDLLLNYDPYEPRKTDYRTRANVNNNRLKSSSYTEGEREAASEVQVVGQEPKGAANVDRVKDIALNSREIRLVGPNQREVEMRDDVASKLVVAMENLQKEASQVWGQMNEKLDQGWTDIKRSEVWGQVNEKLDKGWTDLKTMVEGVVAPASKQAQAAGRREN